MFPRNENQNEGTFAKTTLNYETALNCLPVIPAQGCLSEALTTSVALQGPEKNLAWPPAPEPEKALFGLLLAPASIGSGGGTLATVSANYRIGKSRNSGNRRKIGKKKINWRNVS